MAYIIIVTRIAGDRQTTFLKAWGVENADGLVRHPRGNDFHTALQQGQPSIVVVDGKGKESENYFEIILKEINELDSACGVHVLFHGDPPNCQGFLQKLLYREDVKLFKWSSGGGGTAEKLGEWLETLGRKCGNPKQFNTSLALLQKSLLEALKDTSTDSDENDNIHIRNTDKLWEILKKSSPEDVDSIFCVILHDLLGHFLDPLILDLEAGMADATVLPEIADDWRGKVKNQLDVLYGLLLKGTHPDDRTQSWVDARKLPGTADQVLERLVGGNYAKDMAPEQTLEEMKKALGEIRDSLEELKQGGDHHDLFSALEEEESLEHLKTILAVHAPQKIRGLRDMLRRNLQLLCSAEKHLREKSHG